MWNICKNTILGCAVGILGMYVLGAGATIGLYASDSIKFKEYKRGYIRGQKDFMHGEIHESLLKERA